MKLKVSGSIIFILSIYLLNVQCAKMSLDELKKMVKPISSTCQKKNNVPQDLLLASYSGVFAREKSLMCYYRCLATMLKLMNKQGQFALDKMFTQVDLLVVEELAPRIKEIAKICFDSTPKIDDPCEYTYDLVVCAYNIDSSLSVLSR
ncbi:general odorant-binding protein lush-like [Trichogramma pretiosum]|uniref:general odorant-binding protein lush-like n=1 Tax=Trichogramma pretiosum TaxID=7493 RepID=UPI0006C95A47|nr:general odorant-binding protein lush-like [Trichogramma pretiosum]